MSNVDEKIDTSQWVDDYSDMLYNYAYTRINDHELAHDLVQDTFVSALRSLENFQGKSTVKTWLFSILKRKIIDHWRKQESRKTKPMSSLGYNDFDGEQFALERKTQGKISEIEVNYENQELRSAIMGCIDALPEKWKGIVMDKLVEGNKSEEVCKAYNITPSNLWVIIHRAKLQLRQCLENKWFDS